MLALRRGLSTTVATAVGSYTPAIAVSASSVRHATAAFVQRTKEAVHATNAVNPTAPPPSPPPPQFTSIADTWQRVDATPSDTALLRHVLTWFLQSGHFTDACRLYNHYLDHRCHLNKYIYVALLDGHWARGDHEAALRIYHHMRFSGVHPPCSVYERFIHARLSLGNVHGAMKVYRDAVRARADTQLPRQTIASLVATQLQQHNVLGALDIVNRRTSNMAEDLIEEFDDYLGMFIAHESVAGAMTVYHRASSRRHQFADRSLEDFAWLLLRNNHHSLANSVVEQMQRVPLALHSRVVYESARVWLFRRSMTAIVFANRLRAP